MIKRLMKRIAVKVFSGVILPVEDLNDIPLKEQQGYLVEAKHLMRSKMLKNEMNRIKNVAGIHIIRKASNDTEIAWNRGILHGIDSLDKRLQYLATLKRGEKIDKIIVE